MRWSCRQMNPDLNNVLIFLNLTHLCTTHSMGAFRVSDTLMYAEKKLCLMIFHRKQSKVWSLAINLWSR